MTPCKRGHVSGRHPSGNCIECAATARKKWRTLNPEKSRELGRKDLALRKEQNPRYWDTPARTKYIANNRDRVNEVHRRIRRKRREKDIAYNREWRRQNPEKARAQTARYQKKNPGKLLARTRRRQSVVKQRTPAWADLKKIEAIYVECARITAETGIPHHVDHIYPLQGKLVCGLHVEGNLQIIPAVDNLRKFVSMPEQAVLA